jgi:hyperosmotically inducible protein
MKVNYSKVFVAVIFAVVFTAVSGHANQTDDQIVSSANNSYVYKNYLKDDSIKILSSDGVVTLTGTVSEESHRGLAQKTV